MFKYNLVRTLLAGSPVLHGELRVVLVWLASPHRLLVQRANRGVGHQVVAANHLVHLASAHGLGLNLEGGMQFDNLEDILFKSISLQNVGAT